MRRERRTGRFEYRVYVPGDIDPDGVRAELPEGILTVVVPKAATEARSSSSAPPAWARRS